MSELLAGVPEVTGLLLRLLAALVGVLAAGVTFLLLHHSVSLRRETRRRRRLTAAAEELAPYLAGRPGAAAAVARASRAWGRRAVVTTLCRARRTLAGDRADAISELLEEVGEVRRLARAARRRGPLGRGHALRALGACGGLHARRELLRATADRHPEVRRIAREGLVELRDGFAVRAAVAAFLAETEPSGSATRAFFLRLAAYAPDELRHLAASERLAPELYKAALEALAESGDPAAAPLALEQIRAPAGELRAAAVRLLGAAGDGRWTALVAARLADPEWFVRAAAARALGSLPLSRGALAALGDGLRDSHWWVRANAARSLARLGPPGMHRLARAAGGGDGGAREAAMPELLRLGEARSPDSGGDRKAGLALAS